MCAETTCEKCFKIRNIHGILRALHGHVLLLTESKYDPLIIEKTPCAWPICGLIKSFLKRCTLTYNAMGVYNGPCPSLLIGDMVLILVPSDC